MTNFQQKCKQQIANIYIQNQTHMTILIMFQFMQFLSQNVWLDSTDCNPRIKFSIPGSKIMKFVITVSLGTWDCNPYSTAITKYNSVRKSWPAVIFVQ